MKHLLFRRFWYRCLCLLLVLVTALSVLFVQPVFAQAFLERLLFQGIQVIQLSTISPAQEVRIGQQIHQQLLRQGMKLNADPELNDSINEIGDRLAIGSQRSKVPYRFQVVNDRGVNAFATTGGFVYVTTGLLRAADNEAQLASVIGHEIGHIDSRHLITQMRQAAIARGLMSAVGIDGNTLANLGSELAIRRPRSRRDEFEADQRGLQLISKAGYAEAAVPAFMKKLMGQATMPTFMSTHPAVPDRIKAIETMIDAGDGNSCTSDPELDRCGLNEKAYQQLIRDRLS